jgi:hypothetical protein
MATTAIPGSTGSIDVAEREFLTPENTPSLGWELLAWYETYLRVPAGPDYGKPLRLTDEQATFLVRWYQIDRRGRFIYRRGASRRAKGWGKSPMLAAWAIGELVGPSVFDGWKADGKPQGKPLPAPWVQIAACSEDQTWNTYSAAYAMLAKSPALEECRIDLGRTKAFLVDRPGSVIEPVTASAGSREGQPITAAVLDETHLWLSTNGGRRLAAVLRRNLGKGGGRSLESTNAFLPGERSVAEETHAAWEKGERGLLYDAREGPWVEDLSDKRALRAALKVAYGDAKWVPLTRIIDEIQDPATESADARRYYLNQIVAGQHHAVNPHRWRELADASRVVADGARIGLGFDGSISQDATALVACTEDGHLFVPNVGDKPTIWLRPVNAGRDWLMPRTEIDAAVRAVFDRYDVGRMLCDPPKWQTEIERWAELFGDDIVLFFETYRPQRMSGACDRFSTTLTDGGLSHDGDSLLTSHVLAMVRRRAYVKAADESDGRTRYVFTKGEDGRKIDSGVSALLALEAAATMPAAPAPLPEPDIFFF